MSEDNDQIKQRREKLAALRDGGNAYPNSFRPDTGIREIRDRFNDRTAGELEDTPVRVAVAGRLMSRRIMGKASFANIQDEFGSIQLFLQRDSLAQGHYNDLFKKLTDMGDIIGVKGSLFRTRTGELTISVDSLELLVKALRPLPEKFHGLTDSETRYRQRYVDLIVTEKSRHTFRTRSRTLAYMREYLNNLGYLEIESPMMLSIPGGATARPFVTHHNALNTDLYLRVAQELYIKRVMIGGFDKVYELNRVFRNEGVSTRHNPEFTMLECNESYKDYHEYMDMTEDMLRGLVLQVNGAPVINYQGSEIDFSAKFRRLTMRSAITQFNTEIGDHDLDSFESCRQIARRLGIAVNDDMGRGVLWLEIFESTVEPQLQQPTFITGYPAEVSPLSRPADGDDFLTDRFELFIATREIANGFSEINDPDYQADRFARQLEKKNAGDHEAMHFDSDYIRALEYGLPPNAGLGIGMDRLVMLLTDSASIRDVLLFPYMRPEA